MSFVSTNAAQIFRPLWAGVAIMSSTVRRHGTLGCFARDGKGATWLLTAAHVLREGPATTLDAIDIYQPDYRIGHARLQAGPAWRVDAQDQVIAVALDPQERFMASILGLGPWSGAASPRAGATVAKAGAATGVTRGVVRSVGDRVFDVVPEDGLPSGFVMTTGGDSGAAWIDVASRGVVGLHLGELANGAAEALRIDVLLAELGLQLPLA